MTGKFDTSKMTSLISRSMEDKPSAGLLVLEVFALAEDTCNRKPLNL